MICTSRGEVLQLEKTAAKKEFDMKRSSPIAQAVAGVMLASLNPCER
jgi:hypothetical protein